MIALPILPLPHHDSELPLPAHATDGAAGLDLRACLLPAERAAGVLLPPMGRILVPTGLALAIPSGHEGQVRPRSGLATRHGVTVLNSPGTVDADYRGEVKVALINLSAETWRLTHGERIAQLVIAPYAHAAAERVETLEATGRGTAGFGSTGMG
ncbi:MAG: dUTP diphosphatase [Pseudomonadota bacterium]